jgi:UDP-glucose 4-epimerase
MKQNVLVTGFSGFIGREVCAQLNAMGARIVKMGRASTAEAGSGLSVTSAQWVGDITLDALLAHAGSPDVIIHCASGSSVAASVVDPRSDFSKSVPCVNDLLTFMRLHCPNAKLVFASSAAVYGAAHSGPIAEETQPAPLSPYGLHKQICEELLRFHAHTYGLKIAIVRLFSIYGEGLRKQLLWDACGKICSGNPVFSGTGDEMRDWLHVSDAASLMLAAAEQASVSAPICNGATGKGTSVRDILQALASDLNQKVALRFDGSPRSGDPQSLVGSDLRAGAWGWSARIDWRNGMRRYADWYRSSGG